MAAELALPHRRRRDPFDEPGLDPEPLDEAHGAAQASPRTDPNPSPTRPVAAAPIRYVGNDRRRKVIRKPVRGTADRPGASAPPAPAFRTRALRVPGVGEGAPGRRSRARNRTGAVVGVSHRRCRRARPAPVRHAAGGGGPAARAGGGLRPAPDDVRRAIREGREGNLVIFVVDASGSMAARDRMSAVSGAALSLLRDAYQRRDKVAVITFRGGERELLLPPTSSVAHRRPPAGAVRHRRENAAGAGLLAARDLVVRQKVRDRVAPQPGRGAHRRPGHRGPDPLGRARVAAARLVAEGATAVVVDCETSYIRLGLAGELAGWLGAPVLRLEQLRADHLSRAGRSVA